MSQTQTNQMLPSVRFDLSIQSPGEALTLIGHVTNNFYNIPREILAILEYRIRCKPITTYGFLTAPFNADAAKLIIGHDGFYLKLTTTQSGADFIWHDRQNNIFMFWGNRLSVVKAMHAIRYRMFKYAELEVDYAHADAPALVPAALVPASLVPASLVPAALVPAVVEEDDVVDDELTYYEKKNEEEKDREPENPTLYMNVRSTSSMPTLRCSSSIPTLRCSSSMPTLRCSSSMPPPLSSGYESPPKSPSQYIPLPSLLEDEVVTEANVVDPNVVDPNVVDPNVVDPDEFAITVGMEYLSLDKNLGDGELCDFVRDFDEPDGFIWSTNPNIAVLHDILGTDTDSPHSFAIFLRKLQTALKNKDAEELDGKCRDCGIDLGDTTENPNRLCAKWRCGNTTYACIEEARRQMKLD
jgi:hypothetical protein